MTCLNLYVYTCFVLTPFNVACWLLSVARDGKYFEGKHIYTFAAIFWQHTTHDTRIHSSEIAWRTWFAQTYTNRFLVVGLAVQMALNHRKQTKWAHGGWLVLVHRLWMWDRESCESSATSESCMQNTYDGWIQLDICGLRVKAVLWNDFG